MLLGLQDQGLPALHFQCGKHVKGTTYVTYKKGFFCIPRLPASIHDLAGNNL